MNGAVQLPLDLDELTHHRIRGLPGPPQRAPERRPHPERTGARLAERDRRILGRRRLPRRAAGHLRLDALPRAPALQGHGHAHARSTSRSSFDAVGGEHNAMTAKEYTCYYAKVRDQDLPMAVEVLADMFTSSLLDADEFESERGVILEELAMADDDPSDVVSERFFEAVFGDHPLGRPIGGSPASISAVSRDAVLAALPRQLPARKTSSSRSPAPSTTTSSCAGSRRALDRRRLGSRRRGGARSPAATPWLGLHRPRQPRSRSSTARSSRPTCCSASPGSPPTDDRRADAHRAQLGARRRDVVAAVPGGAREARPGLLGVLVRRELLRRRARRPLRRMLAQERRAASPS